MQISNDIHYSSDAYLLSKKQYEIDHKTEFESDELQSDISAPKLEEKPHARSINASNSAEDVASHQNTANGGDTAVSNAAAEKALASYNSVEMTRSSQEYFNQIKETV